MLVSLSDDRPGSTSATYKSMEKKLLVDRKASHRPSGLMEGPTLRSAPSPLPSITRRPTSIAVSRRENWRRRS